MNDDIEPAEPRARLYFDDGFPVSGEPDDRGDDGWDFSDFDDRLTEHCRRFILEADLPDDIAPNSIRDRVWRAIGIVERIRLALHGVRP